MDTLVKLRAPLGVKKVAYGPPAFDFAFGVDADGTFSVPAFAVPDLLSSGCSREDGNTEAIDVSTALAAASDGEISIYLTSRGIPPQAPPFDPRNPRDLSFSLPSVAELRAKSIELHDLETSE